MESDSLHTVRTIGGESRYSNFFKVGYNAFEFIMDCGQAYGDRAGEEIHTRIVTTPSYTKALAELLLESLRQYENSFGPIPYGVEEEPVATSEVA